MAIVKGYFNTQNGVFLGPVTAKNEDGVAFTPRYVEGVCFGEYDTETDEFIPLTNPMIIPKGAIFTQDDQIIDGKNVTMVSGIEEDKGADLVRKGSVAGYKFTPSNVETRDEKGRPVDESRIIRKVPEKTKPSENKFKEAKRPIIVAKETLPVIDWEKLF